MKGSAQKRWLSTTDTGQSLACLMAILSHTEILNGLIDTFPWKMFILFTNNKGLVLLIMLQRDNKRSPGRIVRTSWNMRETTRQPAM